MRPVGNKMTRVQLILMLLIPMVALLSSCTIWKRSERRSILDSYARMRSVQDSAGWTLTQSGRLLQIAHSGQRILILPHGSVRYHPDSGFSGEAGYLLLESYRHTATSRQDSLQFNATREQRSDSLDSQLHHSDHRQRETDVQPVWRLPWWGWGILLLGVVAWGWKIGSRLKRSKTDCP